MNLQLVSSHTQQLVEVMPLNISKNLDLPLLNLLSRKITVTDIIIMHIKYLNFFALS